MYNLPRIFRNISNSRACRCCMIAPKDFNRYLLINEVKPFERRDLSIGPLKYPVNILGDCFHDILEGVMSYTLFLSVNYILNKISTNYRNPTYEALKKLMQRENFLNVIENSSTNLEIRDDEEIELPIYITSFNFEEYENESDRLYYSRSETSEFSDEESVYEYESDFDEI
uniref:ORFan n=1 Tax=Strongyloides venezuelensis TaxID=75913 RepID=A0A0K0FQX5_STRVS